MKGGEKEEEDVLEECFGENVGASKELERGQRRCWGGGESHGEEGR